MKVLSIGSEATVYASGSEVIKKRLKKKYRIDEIDDRLRAARTASEFRILSKCSMLGINVPRPISMSKEGATIVMEMVDGAGLDSNFKVNLMPSLGEMIASIHKAGIIHGDITTANVLVKGEKLYIIDFGLGYFSLKPEDRASDLFLIKNALNSRHPKDGEAAYSLLLKAYKRRMGKEFKAIDTHLKDIEKRRRYHESS